MTTLKEGKEKLYGMLKEIGGSPERADVVLRELNAVLVDEEFLPENLHTSEVIVATVVFAASVIAGIEHQRPTQENESLIRFVEMLGGVLGVSTFVCDYQPAAYLDQILEALAVSAKEQA